MIRGAFCILRKTLLVGLTLAAVGIGSLLVVPPAGPRLVFAWGYGDAHLLEPLTEHKGGILSFFTNKKRTRSNWDGTWLFVEGACGACGKPQAPRGSFVLANLPRGLAYCHHDGSGKYAHMTVPRYVRRSTLAVLSAFLALYPALAFLRGPLRRLRRRRQGRCVRCGYDLTGNVTGVCSECGEARHIR